MVCPHIERGGWTWYTGSASWMYRLILESLLGLRRAAGTLHVAPCLPPDWEGFKLHYRYRSSLYHIAVTQAQSATGTATGAAGRVLRLSVDGTDLDAQAIPLVDDGSEHLVQIRVAAASRDAGSEPVAAR